jgi:hypothetical protein
MIFDLLKYVFLIVISIIIFYFILANLSTISSKQREIECPTVLDQNHLSNQFDPINQQRIENEIESYGQKLVNQASSTGKDLAEKIKENYIFKKKSMPQDESKVGLLNTMLKYVSPVGNFLPKAPDLENYEDYAPTDSPITSTQPILSTTQLTPNYLKLAKDSDLNPSKLLAINEYDQYQPANFLSERTAPWFNQISSADHSFFFPKKSIQIF